MSDRAPAGWYAPDPRRPAELRYWDGSAWASLIPPARPAASRSTPGWLTSWPAIAVGFVLFVVPGVILLWRRPGTSALVKSAITAGLVALLALAGALTPAPTPDTPVVGAVVPTETPKAQRSPTPTPTPTPTPAPTDPAPSVTSAPSDGDGSAIAAALALRVKGRAPKTGYDRAQFGPAWVDVDRNGCDTRNDMLIATLTNRVMSGRCKVLSGDLADPYTGRSIHFVRGGASEVDVDHVVALSDAWQKGATPWPYAKRVAFANDPVNLQPTDASANRQKGDSDTANWLPPNKSYRCTYVARQVAVKAKYAVWVTAAEQEAMLRVLRSCPSTDLPGPGSQPTIASNTGGPPPSPTPTRLPPPPPSTGGATDPRFSTCRDAKAAGYGPYVRGVDPEYDWYRDGDSDGTVCE